MASGVVAWSTNYTEIDTVKRIKHGMLWWAGHAVKTIFSRHPGRGRQFRNRPCPRWFFAVEEDLRNVLGNWTPVAQEQDQWRVCFIGCRLTALRFKISESFTFNLSKVFLEVWVFFWISSGVSQRIIFKEFAPRIPSEIFLVLLPGFLRVEPGISTWIYAGVFHGVYAGGLFDRLPELLADFLLKFLKKFLSWISVMAFQQFLKRIMRNICRSSSRHFFLWVFQRNLEFLLEFLSEVFKFSYGISQYFVSG